MLYNYYGEIIRLQVAGEMFRENVYLKCLSLYLILVSCFDFNLCSMAVFEVFNWRLIMWTLIININKVMNMEYFEIIIHGGEAHKQQFHEDWLWSSLNNSKFKGRVCVTTAIDNLITKKHCQWCVQFEETELLQQLLMEGSIIGNKIDDSEIVVTRK